MPWKNTIYIVTDIYPRHPRRNSPDLRPIGVVDLSSDWFVWFVWFAIWNSWPLDLEVPAHLVDLLGPRPPSRSTRSPPVPAPPPSRSTRSRPVPALTWELPTCLKMRKMCTYRYIYIYSILLWQLCTFYLIHENWQAIWSVGFYLGCDCFKLVGRVQELSGKRSGAAL